MSNSVDFYKGIFLHVIPVRIIVPWPRETPPVGIWVNNQINHLHEHSLYIAYKDTNDGGPYHIETSPLICRDLLKKDNSFNVHDRNIHFS